MHKTIICVHEEIFSVKVLLITDFHSSYPTVAGRLTLNLYVINHPEVKT